ncbi:hypothetical protein D9M72_534820 [compost metagenome]
MLVDVHRFGVRLRADGVDARPRDELALVHQPFGIQCQCAEGHGVARMQAPLDVVPQHLAHGLFHFGDERVRVVPQVEPQAQRLAVAGGEQQVVAVVAMAQPRHVGEGDGLRAQLQAVRGQRQHLRGAQPREEVAALPADQVDRGRDRQHQHEEGALVAHEVRRDEVRKDVDLGRHQHHGAEDIDRGQAGQHTVERVARKDAVVTKGHVKQVPNASTTGVVAWS